MDWGKQVMKGISDITREDSGTLSQRIKDAVILLLTSLLVKHLASVPLRVLLCHGLNNDLGMLQQGSPIGFRKKNEGSSI